MGFEAFAAAGSVAVVGLSPRNRIARITAGNLRSRGYHGRVVGVHPSGEDVDGVPTAVSLDEPVDVAVLCMGAPRLAGALEDLAGRGVRRFVIPGAGANEGGRQVETALADAAGRLGIEVLGPNCMGFVSLVTGCVPYVGTLDPDLRAGSVGLVSQSGSVCELFTALPDRVGFSHVISVGNELGIDLAGTLGFLVDDPATRAIGLFVEGVRRPEAFREALHRAAEAGKEVVALKVGSSAAARAGTVTHTGVLAGDAAVFSSVLRDAGAMEAGDLGQLLVALELLGKRLTRPPTPVVAIGDSGGQANLLADHAEALGVDLAPLRPATRRALSARFPALDAAADPLDLWALDDPVAAYRDGVSLVLKHEPHLVVLALDKFLAGTEPERAFVRAAVEAVGEPGAAVLMAFAGGDRADPSILRAAWDRRVPVVRGARETLSALTGLDRWRRWREEPAQQREPRPGAAMPARTEDEAMALLEAAGVPVPRRRQVAGAEEAVDAARAIGFPVVAKVGGVAHKTEVGGVRLGLWSEDQVRDAAADLLALGPTLLVAEERTGDLELLVSAFRDEQFGPCGLLGLGGTWAEALEETVVVAGPGDERGVRRALETTRWGRLVLEGGRGRRWPAEAVARVVLRLIDLVAGGEVDTVEVNPLLVGADGVVAVDALVVPRGGGR